MKWPDGIAGSGLNCGIKDGVPDLGLIVCEEPVDWSGVFTRNAAAAAPVGWCRSRLGARVRAIVVNSGNANACTGTAGEDAVRATAGSLATLLDCSSEEVLVASTGPIGVRLPVDKIQTALPAALGALSVEVDSFAQAILTTDTGTKTAQAEAGEARVVGVAKGAAMIAPNMATMLAFIATDAKLGDAGTVLRRASDRSFGRITIDGCESTNDSVFLLSTGAVTVPDDGFAAALETVCAELATQIVADAEGASKLVRITVTGAADEAAAVTLARAVAGSDLWRAAIHGADPNWGRVLAALGQCDRSLDLRRLEVAIGGVPVFSDGEPAPATGSAAAAMAGERVDVLCRVGDGNGEATVLTSDLSPEYVRLNAVGTS